MHRQGILLRGTVILLVTYIIVQSIWHGYVFAGASNADNLINSLAYERSQGFDSAFSAVRYVMVYAMFLREIPNSQEIISFMNSRQGTDGLFDGGKHSHYSAELAITLSAYKILNATPTISLDGWFQTIDTWGEVLVDSGTWEVSGNFWGGLWGYTMAWIIHYREEPPWINDYINLANTHPETWISDNHQRSHVYYILFTLQKPLPFLDDVITNTLGDQKADGSWITPSYTSPINEAMQAIHLLKGLIDGNFAPSRKAEMESALQKAKPWVDSCYWEPVPGYGVFKNEPSSQYSDFETTWSGSMAAVDVGLLFGWTDPLYLGFRVSHSYTLTIQSSPIASVQFTLNGSLATTPYSMKNSEGIYIVAMPSSLLSGTTNYTFFDWEDGSNNPTRTIDLRSNMSITAFFRNASSPGNGPPYAVTLYEPSEIRQDSIRLTWTQSEATDFLEYKIFLSTTADTLGTLVTTITNRTTSSHVVSELAPNTTYYFTVRVADNEELYRDSNRVSARTLSLDNTIPEAFPTMILIIVFFISVAIITLALMLRKKTRR